MIGRRSVIGVVMALALAFAAFAAANASAEQRAFACETGGAEFSDAHCLNTGGTLSRKLTLIPGENVAITATSEKTASETTASTPSQLSGTLAGVATELECTLVKSVAGTGKLTNAASSVSGSGKLTYTGCVVLKPAGKGCKVNNGTVNTEELKATTVGQAANKLKFEMVGTKFANVEIKECTTTALNNTFPVTGSLVANTSGATTTTNKAEIETQNTLKFGGNKAGLGGAITISSEKGGTVLK
jgi:hypothetical protein